MWSEKFDNKHNQSMTEELCSHTDLLTKWRYMALLLRYREINKLYPISQVWEKNKQVGM